MRVLDVGCGVGDTTFLAADLTGPGGLAVGVDRSADAIATARARAEKDGRRNVIFLQGELGTPIPNQAPFDAVVGRYVLIHQANIPSALRGLRTHLRPGGLLAFHEFELDLRMVSDPSSDLVLRTLSWLHQAVRLAGMQLHAVSQMPRYFHEAGLGWPETQIHPLVSSGPDGFGPNYMISTLRTLAPVLYKAGIATAEEIGLDTLEQRLRDACANGAAQMAQVNGGAWARLA